MRIIYHHRTQGTGAEGVHIAHIVKELRALGHVVDVVSPGDQDPLETAGNSPYAKRQGLKQRVFSVISRRAPQLLFECLELSYNLVAYRKLRQAISAKRFHGQSQALDGPQTSPHNAQADSQADSEPVGLLYERYAFFTIAGAYLARRTGTPYIVEVNEVAGEERLREQVLVTLAQQCERYVFEQADSIIVVSDFLKSKIVDLGVREEKIVVMSNGVDESAFDPEIDASDVRAQHGFREDTVVIGFVGWFVAWHNLELLVEAFADVAGDRDARLFLVGDGDLKKKLLSIAESRGVADKVVFPGAVPYRSIPRYVQAMDVCVIPGSNAYRSPIKLFEYMAMKKAVLAPEQAPILRVVTRGHDGVTFRPGDREDMRDKLHELVVGNQRRRELGENARATIVSRHLWRHNAERVLELNRRRGRPSAVLEIGRRSQVAAG